MLVQLHIIIIIIKRSGIFRGRMLAPQAPPAFKPLTSPRPPRPPQAAAVINRVNVKSHPCRSRACPSTVHSDTVSDDKLLTGVE